MNKRYYWLKIGEYFFEDEKIQYLESLENGHKYINFWVKLLLKCLKNKDSGDYGFLRFSKKIPYNEKLLSDFTRLNIDIVRVAMKYLIELEMIEILEDDTIYIEAVQKMIGSESESAERVRKHRAKIENLVLNNNKPKKLHSNKKVTEKKRNKEIEIYKEKDIYIYKDIDFSDLLSFWIKADLIEHQLSTIKNQIKKRHADNVKDVGIEATKKAIMNYSIVLKGEKFYWTHSWSFWNFIARGLYQFIDDAKPLENFLKKRTKQNKKTNSYFENNKDLLQEF